MKKQTDNREPWLGELANMDIRVQHGEIDLVEEAPAERRKHRLRNWTLLFALPLMLAAIAGWLVAGMYLSKIQIGTELVAADQPDSALEHIIQARATSYKLVIVYPDGSRRSHTLKDMGLVADVASTLANARDRQHLWESRLFWWRPIVAYLTIKSADDAKLQAFIAQQASVTIQPAKDATLAIENGEVKISDSAAGKHYGLTQPVSSLYIAASNLRTAPLHLDTLSTRPAITSRQLAPYAARLERILNQKVVFTVDGKNVQASADDIATWVELTPKDGGKNVDIAVNSGKVLAYINKISAAAVHPPKAQIVISHADGSTSVLVKGINGTDVVDKSAAASEVAQNVLDAKGADKNLSVQYAAFKTVTAQAYDKWIEVDTTNKRMYAYEQTNLVRTFLISAGAPRTPTPLGQYAIYAKYVQQDMRGQNVDGSSYFQPAVPWVNYFYGGDAIHGNYWRPLSYFGNINSSHGCVGIVDSDAQWVYSWAPIGTPVIVHA